MKLLSKITAALLVTISSSHALASYASTQNQPPHIWHHLIVANGEWHAQLQVINQADKAWFVLPDGETKVSSLEITPSAPKKVGLFLDYAQKPDFDLAYTVTLIKNEKGIPNMTSKSCIFLVTATGPGKPDISINAYNGASCHWAVAERGEDFYAA